MFILSPGSCPRGGTLGHWGCLRGQIFFQTWSCGILNRPGWRAEQNASNIFILGSNWWPWGEVKRSNIISMSISKIFIPNSLCVFSQIEDRKHIAQNFHSVARVMPQGGTCGCWEESKTSAWEFAMAPHRLRAQVFFFKINIFKKIPSATLSVCHTVCIQIRPNILSVLIWVQKSSLLAMVISKKMPLARE